MNFFEHQDRARKKSRGLILLFLVALAGITAGIYAVSRFAVWYFECGTDTACTVPIWDPVDFAQVSAAVVIFVGLVSLAKHLSLRGGGAAVAEMLGGREIDATTKDRHEKRLVNVVEEMAIAAGVPMPRVFVLSGEGAINAFAAGYSPEDAAVAVTQGTLERLSRDELQGVVAHEFSHILHGDIRLNVRMISVLFGILAIGIVGRGVLRASFYAGDRPRRRSGKDGGALPFLIIVGLALVIVGYIGTLVGRVIQSAISRQREFLADASAVAYTRNPDGIAGALKKIGGFSEHALLKTAKAGQAAHLFFGQGVRVRLFKNALSTHPPLAERIRRIDPAFDGDFPESESVGPIDLDAIFDDPTARAAPASVAPDLAGAAAQMAGANYRPKWARERMAKASDIADSVGRVSAGNVAAAGSVRRAIPEALQQSAADPGGATHLIGALVLDGEDELRARQLRALAKAAGDDAARGATEAWAIVRDLDPRLRLPLVDLAAPALRRLADAARVRFLAALDDLVKADGQVTAFEFCVAYLVRRRMTEHPARLARVRFFYIHPLKGDVQAVLAAIARAGHADRDEDAAGAMRAGLERLPDLDDGAAPAPGREIAFEALAHALDRLGASSMGIRRKVIDACAHAAFADKWITVDEAEMLRVVSAALGCPLPPFVETWETRE